MSEAPADFGTGLRAHLRLDEPEPTSLDVAIAKVEHAREPVAQPMAQPIHFPDTTAVDALAAREAALEEREYQLSLREANLSGRAASILAAAQALYDELPGTGVVHDEEDELARLRRRKTVA
ncbi:MAG: hypothetical protein QOF45_329 [Gaiellaceae bacterium]|jgi:hypothetical protein|nr:hypothetical protein [Gaiellaceae bacterium]